MKGIENLTEKEVLNISGGRLGPFVVGWLLKEIISGIYQATERNCHVDRECS